MVKIRLGDLLVAKQLISSEQLNEALKIQIGGNRRLGYLLIKMKLITEDQLIEALMSQDTIEVVRVSDEFSSDVQHMLPRYLCQRYSALPLRKKEHNVLRVAMVDPSDDAAIQEIEDYTGTAVESVLAREHEISEGINRYIPMAMNDFVNPQAMTSFTKVASAIALVAIVALSILSYKYVQKERYGSMTDQVEAVIYKNHDIMVSVNKGTGLITLLGHGAYSEGHYSVSFRDSDVLGQFVQKKKGDFSEKQHDWLTWLISRKLVS